MDKIICDVCGTSYPETAECCPICGCTRDEAANLMTDELMMDELLMDPNAKSGRFAPKKREIFDFDEVNAEEESLEDEADSYGDEDEEPAEDDGSQNTLAIILLTALITVLLFAAGFLFVRFYLPGVRGEETVKAPVETEAAEMPTQTTSATIPCDSLALVSGMATGDSQLTQPGQKFLIHVMAYPENTTDKITYTSEDESVATVSADGQVVAVGEGETVIQIACGDIQMPFNVSCSFVQETTAPTETTVATEETTVPTEPAVTELKLNRKDFTLPIWHTFQLLLVDSDLEQTDVEWKSSNLGVATVDKEGKVTAVGYGISTITARYGDVEVSCVMRCN